VKSGVKEGGLSINHNQMIIAVKSSVKAGIRGHGCEAGARN
jgi:hypothetical protein